MQEDACRRAALAAGAASVSLFSDPGHSGTTLKRPALQELLRRLPDFDALYVYRLDRLTRRLRDRLALLDACMEAGVSVHSLSEKIDLDTIMGRAMVNMLAVFSEMEVETLRERVRDALRHRTRTLGLTHGKPAYGYRVTAKGLPVEHHPDEAPVVLEIFHRYAAGESLGHLAQDLNRRAVPLQQDGALWWPNAVRRMLGRRTYLGEVKSGAEWLPGKHPALVPGDLFSRVARRLRAAGAPGPRVRGGSLASVYSCAVCGGPMTKGGWDKARGNGPRYTCKHRGPTPPENRHEPNSVAADKADAGLWAYVEWLLEGGSLREGIELRLQRLAQERGSDQAARDRRRLRELDAQLGRALRGYSLGNIPEAVYQELVHPLNVERARLEENLEALIIPAELRETAAYLRRLTPGVFIAALRKQPAEVQVAFLRRFLESAEVQGNALTFIHLHDLPPWAMVLPPRWEKKREVGAFPLPDGSVTTGRSPRPTGPSGP